jgi:pimeloyl-[acyl-carrier protein] methyl ester esterase
MRLLLLPGLDGTDVLFEPLQRQLATTATALTYPQVGPNSYADLLPGVLDQLPTVGDYVLLGWSFSGPLALMAAATRPPGLRGIVLAASFVRKPVFYLPRAVRLLVRPFLFRYVAQLSSAKALLGGYRSEELKGLLRRAHGHVPPTVMAERVRATLTVDVRQELRNCPVPILYLGATRDFVVPRWNARGIVRARPDVDLEFIEGPHLALATNPTAATQAVQSFVDRLRCTADDAS